MKKMLSVVMLVLVSVATPWHADAQRSPVEVVTLKNKAATGDAKAQSSLGHMYDFGTGVPQNKTEALRLYRLAAAQGDADAQTNIGDMYRRGIGISEDHTEAVKWYRLAADQGDAKARNTLGDMYRLGEGVPEDLGQAYNWYTLAASAGNAYAENSKNLVEKELHRRAERHPFAAAGSATSPNLTAAHRNAVRSANSYLKGTGGFSRLGLIDQLQYEQYTVEDATVAVNSLDVDWRAQAVRSAASYLKMSGFSCQGLIDQLQYEKYTVEQATYGAVKVGIC